MNRRGLYHQLCEQSVGVLERAQLIIYLSLTFDSSMEFLVSAVMQQGSDLIQEVSEDVQNIHGVQQAMA